MMLARRVDQLWHSVCNTIWLPAAGDVFTYGGNPRLGVWLVAEERQATDDELCDPVRILSVDGPANLGIGDLSITVELADGKIALDQYFRKSHATYINLYPFKRKNHDS